MMSGFTIAPFNTDRSNDLQDRLAGLFAADFRTGLGRFFTEEGRLLFEEVVPAHEDLVHQQMSALSEEEQAQLHELLRELDHSL